MTSATVATRNLVGRTVADVERDLILDTLDHCLGNRTHAANILGISIRTLRNKLREYSDAGLSHSPAMANRGWRARLADDRHHQRGSTAGRARSSRPARCSTIIKKSDLGLAIGIMAILVVLHLAAADLAAGHLRWPFR